MNRYESTNLMREQIQLLKTQRELTALISKVDEQLNQLLVWNNIKNATIKSYILFMYILYDYR